MCGDTGARLPPLFRCFKQKLSHLAGSQTLHQVIKRAMLEPALATAIFFAASEILPDIRRPQQIRRGSKLCSQNCFSLLQS
ncbi:MAG TPA: hypothetical protein VK840_04015 [Candidatus Dormibacteraeota bacterium]|nr:hypothetical protein [Candidatus Dormibacteraeota bacterium]